MSTSITSITLNNKVFKLVCNPDEEKELHKLANSLNNRLIQLKNKNHVASFELLLVMAALSLEEENLNLKTNKPETVASTSISEAQELVNNMIISLTDIANKLGI